ncbi:MAG: hypothetical protein LBS58_01550 [Coriobacteriales bacterium]|jgi:trigger factor|nr:hypothetical protein [Coriobacteriales bacterium]
MKIVKKDRPDGKIQLTVTIPAARVNEVLDTAAFTLAMQNGINPQDLEPGNLVASVVEKVGEPQYLAFVDHYTMTFLAPFAVTEKGLSIIMAPEVSSEQVVARDKEFTFTAVVTPKPEYELKSYDPVSISLPTVKVAEEEIDQQLLMLAQNRAQLVRDDDRAVQMGDDILIAIESKDDKGEIVKNLTAGSRRYTLGDGFLGQKFDDNLIGMNVGETKSFDYEIPAPEGMEDAQSIVYATTVTVKEVQKKVIPAITNAWVEVNIPGLSTVAELREAIRKEGEAHKNKELENMKMFSAASELATRFQGSIADEIYEYTRGEIMANMRAQLRQQNMDLKQYLEQQGIEEQQFSMNLMMETREVLRQGFSLDALARHLGFTVSEEDITDTFARMAPGREQEARREFEVTGRLYLIREAALRTKANLWLAETANITYVEN